MDFVRRHLFYMICGVVAAAGIALGVTSCLAMPEIGKQMAGIGTLYHSLESVKQVNRERLEAERKRINLILSDRDKVFARARKLYGYEPLVPDVFPNGDNRARLAFRKAYGPAMDKLLRSLNYGSPATSAGISYWRDKIADELAREKERGLDPGAAPTTVHITGPARTPAGVLTRAGARTDPVPRAHMAAAQRAYCYAVHFFNRKKNEVSSLEFPDSMRDTGTLDAPELGDVWQAQLAYWIQKDVVEAIVAINQEAAEEAHQKGQDAWLGIMPVKDLISIRLYGGYVQPGTDPGPLGQPGGPEEASPPGSAEAVFTHSASTDWYEVVQFTVKVVMDQRDILRFVDRLCKGSFHTLLRVAYQAVPPNKKMVGKIYGSEPTVSVVLDFETIMLGDVFRPLMPTTVCEDYEIACPPREDDDG